MNKERIQKALARQGLGSRRQIETWIKEGKISLNSNPAKIGDLVSAGDRIMFSGRKIVIQAEETNQFPRVICYHKPEGQLCTRRDPEGRPTIFDNLPALKNSRWIAVGRLDLNTSGLLLLTDNGELANRLMHPSQQIEREYAVRVLGEVTDDMLKQLTNGVELEDGMARFEEIVDSGGEGANHWYHVVLMEGRNREVRRMWEAVGVKVSRLMRVRFGPIVLNNSLRPGKSRDLPAKKIAKLGELVGLEYVVDEKAEQQKAFNKAKYKTKQNPRSRSPRR
ncbi:MAG: pseudouridine synthase [Gammaproteobacteria bacterium]|nr:pseudouridine synthase [Gammaproteobacteria bacterium]